jgi:hypothetical protein
MESPVPEYRASDWLSDEVSHKPGLRTSLFTAVIEIKQGFLLQTEHKTDEGFIAQYEE